MCFSSNSQSSVFAKYNNTSSVFHIILLKSHYDLNIKHMSITENTVRFLPRTKQATIILGVLIFVSISVAVSFFWLSSVASGGILFALFMALGIISCMPLPMLGYRFFALNRAYYDLDRNVLIIHWGLRTEVIPIREIQWIRPASDLVLTLPNPKLTLPGAYLGIRNIEGLGKVEYLADRLSGALLVAAPQVVYVISPEDVRGFINYYSKGVELGSLESVTAESIQPSFIIGKLWDDRIVRNLIFSGFLIGVTVLLWSVLIITSRTDVVFGYQLGKIIEPMPSIRLLLLPVVNGLVFLIDTVASAFFYRREDQKFISYLICSGSSVTGFLILIALLLVTINP
jgi:hypothetical protein